MNTLRITTLQADLHWEAPAENRAMFAAQIEAIGHPTDVIVLPEMWSTGFSMRSAALAEPMDGPSVAWMAEQAAARQAVVTGSLIVADSGQYRNRMIWMRPDGSCAYYDKHQLFKMAGEHAHYAAGQERVVVEHGGWRIGLAVCYDLRFPVWLRNVTGYDLLLVVASWPMARRTHWQTLLQARAIENQSYVIGVNRVGTDGNGLDYAGDTMVVTPYGEVEYHAAHRVATATHTLLLDHVQDVRRKIPYLGDRDAFELI